MESKHVEGACMIHYIDAQGELFDSLEDFPSVRKTYHRSTSEAERREPRRELSGVGSPRGWATGDN